MLHISIIVGQFATKHHTFDGNVLVLDIFI